MDAPFNCHSDAKGHTGFVIFPDLCGSCGVMIKSIKQQTVADSSAEAELVALHKAIQNLLYINALYEEMGCKQELVLLCMLITKPQLSYAARRALTLKEDQSL